MLGAVLAAVLAPALAAALAAALGGAALAAADGAVLPDELEQAPTASAAMAPRAMILRVRMILLRTHTPSATGSWCCRFHMRRTALPSCASASVEDVDRFCCVTTSSAPASSVTRYRVSGPRY